MCGAGVTGESPARRAQQRARAEGANDGAGRCPTAAGVTAAGVPGSSDAGRVAAGLPVGAARRLSQLPEADGEDDGGHCPAAGAEPGQRTPPARASWLQRWR